MQKSNKTKMLVMIALLIAMDVILTRFLSIHTFTVRIGFGFIPIAVCGMMYGFIWAGVTAVLSDLIGVFMFPTGTGAFFPGFTVSAALIGIVFGLLLHKPKKFYIAIPLAAFINCFGIGLFITTYWLSFTRVIPYWVLFFSERIFQSLVMFAVQFSTLIAIEKTLGDFIRKEQI